MLKNVLATAITDGIQTSGNAGSPSTLVPNPKTVLAVSRMTPSTLYYFANIGGRPAKQANNMGLNKRSRIYDKGDLSNPGNAFPTVFDAIKSAGGITTYSDLSSIEIIRKNSISNGGGKIKKNVN